MKVRQVQYALMIAESGSFSAAADELHISRSSLSRQIIALEKELGFRLFDRSRHKISLTQAGETFIKHAQDLNNTYLAMLSDLGAYKEMSSIAILSLPFIAQYGIASFLTRFKNAYPHFDTTLEEREPLPIFRALYIHTCDVAFVRDNYLDTTLFDALPVKRDQFLVAVSAKHKLARRKSVALRELAGENFVMHDRSSLIDQVEVQACRAAGFEPHSIFTSLRAESMLSLVAQNNGIALMMQRVFEHSMHRGVTGIPLEEPITSNVVLIWLRDKKPGWPVKTFIDFMRTAVTE